jgi:hypothetical protein
MKAFTAGVQTYITCATGKKSGRLGAGQQFGKGSLEEGFSNRSFFEEKIDELYSFLYSPRSTPQKISTTLP